MIMNSVISNPIIDVEEKDINFYDYDGTLVESWSLDELQNKTSLPLNPTHEGLIAQGWNWTLEELKSDNGMTDVGQCYITNDGATRLYISFPANTPSQCRYLKISFRQSVANGATINWGDGSPTETFSNTGNFFIEHTYSQNGLYIISALPNDNCTIGIPYNITGGGVLDSNNNRSRNLINIELGKNLVSIDFLNLSNYPNLETITFPNTLTWTTNASFGNDYNLRCIVVPHEKHGFWGGGGTFARLSKLVAICVSKATINPGWYAFQGYAPSVQRFNTRNFTATGDYISGWNCLLFLDLSSIQGDLRNMTSMTGLQKVIFGTQITQAPAVLEGSTALQDVLFKGTTPFTITNSNAFKNVPTSCIFRIPYDSTDYLSATNYPNPATYIYCGYGTFNDGTTLPTSPTDTGYSLVWYANVENLISQTNPITVGNGKEVYCRYTEVV